MPHSSSFISGKRFVAGELKLFDSIVALSMSYRMTVVDSQRFDELLGPLSSWRILSPFYM
ncbi:MAG: hypothetical protein LBD67_05410 [Candidatus Accumulibacter sp.]|nr:hypothetical protein [Accumulibacter sp.]